MRLLPAPRGGWPCAPAVPGKHRRTLIPRQEQHRDSQAVVPEHQLQVPLLHCKAPVFWSGQAGDAFRSHLLDDMGAKLRVDPASKRHSELSKPGSDILLRMFRSSA